MLGNRARFPQRPLHYVKALAASAVCTAIAMPFYPSFGTTNIAMLYLLGTTFCALRLGRGPAVLMSVTNALALDFFFIPPLLSFDIEDIAYLFALIAMVVVALVIANLVITIQQHRDLAEARERRTAILYDMSRELACALTPETMAAAAVRHICSVFHCHATVLLAGEGESLSPVLPDDDTSPRALLPPHYVEPKFAHEIADRGERGIKGGVYLPLRGSKRVRGVIVVRPQPADRTPSDEELNLLDAFAAQLALALQRVRLAEAAETAKIAEERSSLRNTLLASISHDLRTPLSAIAGAASLIAESDYELDRDRRSTLGRLIEGKARDMVHLLSNVLELVRMESGNGVLRTDWHTIDDLISHSLRAQAEQLSRWPVYVTVATDAPMVLVESTLIARILGNLLENATKYTPPGTVIRISARTVGSALQLVVADSGPGLPGGDTEQLFEKFHRGRSEGAIPGVGLGLAICRAAARLHGGDIRASQNPGGGARFEVEIPTELQTELPIRRELELAAIA